MGGGIRRNGLPRSLRFRQRRWRRSAVAKRVASSSSPRPPTGVPADGLAKRRPLGSGRCRRRSRRRCRCIGSSFGDVRSALLLGGRAERFLRCGDTMHGVVRRVSQRRSGPRGFEMRNEVPRTVFFFERVSRAAKRCGPSGPTRDARNTSNPIPCGAGVHRAPGHVRHRESGKPDRNRRWATTLGFGLFRYGPFGRDNARRGRQTERFCRLRGRSKPLKGKAQGRYRRETKPERLREERNVKRLKKPEGVAQPGEANPV
jgi:hypothetical protein